MHAPSLPLRRRFLGRAGSVLGSAALPWASQLALMGNAAAQQSGSGYKAIVCVFLYGGNDAYNTVLATDAASWSSYEAARRQLPDSIALLSPGTPATLAAEPGSPERLGGVLPITPLRSQGRQFALHPQLAALRPLFQDMARLAIVANVGPLHRATRKLDLATAGFDTPPRLYSHNDQQSGWQTLTTEGPASQGWGALLCDPFMPATPEGADKAASVSVNGSALWSAGSRAKRYVVSPTGPMRLGVNADGEMLGSALRGAALERVATIAYSTHLLERDLAAMAAASRSTEQALRNSLLPIDYSAWATPASGTASYVQSADPKLQYFDPIEQQNRANNLAAQLQMVLRMVQAGRTLGLHRQVFFVGLGGFDTHSDQNARHASLMAQLANALAYFDTGLGVIGALNEVTTFTASDFGRTFISNGDGTDHGWGAHHFVMGGAVKGQDIYGSFPAYGAINAALGSFTTPHQLGRGEMLPTTSVEQLGATLGAWFGLDPASLVKVFPRLGNFSANNLGFMR